MELVPDGDGNSDLKCDCVKKFGMTFMRAFNVYVNRGIVHIVCPECRKEATMNGTITIIKEASDENNTVPKGV